MPATLHYEQIDRQARDEGNAAHWLAAITFNRVHTIEELIDRKAPNGIYITPEMADYVDQYMSEISNRQPRGLMEVETSFGGENWFVSARADHISHDPDASVLRVDDLKYGWRIVEPELNWTLLAHAIGYSISRQITPKTIELIVHQPRPHHRSGKRRIWSIEWAQLMEFYNQLAATLSNPPDNLQTGPLCAKCLSLPNCPAATMASYNSIDISTAVFDDEISNDVLSFELDELSRAKAVIESRYDALCELANHRITKGEVVENYSLENQYANTTWLPHATVELMQLLTGKDISKKQLVTPRQATQKYGIPEDVIKPFTERRQTGKKLVRVTANKKAETIFGKR